MNQASAPTQTIADKYRLVRLIGRGGMGSVWEATHVSLGTTFAIKLIESQEDLDEEVQLRFLNEARAAARLQSRHVVRVFDHGVTDSGDPYIAMELLQGEPLSNRLARVRRLSMQDTATIIAQVARALNLAHSQGIVHRDLKPENIFLTQEPDSDEELVKVVDFGIAKFPRSSSDMAPCTRTGEVMGTPYYMSPEQARGIKSADHRADLWSLGVIAYRCVVGELPFDGNTLVDLMIRITTSDVPVPSAHADDVPEAFDKWFAKAVAREPEERFQTANELAAALAGIAEIPFAQEASLRRMPALDPSAETLPIQALGNATSPKVYSSTLGRKSASARQKRTPLLVGAIALVATLSGIGVYATVRNTSQAAPVASEAASATEPPPGSAATQAPAAMRSAVPASTSATADVAASATASATTSSTLTAEAAPVRTHAPVRPPPTRTTAKPRETSPPPATTPTAAATDVGY